MRAPVAPPVCRKAKSPPAVACTVPAPRASTDVADIKLEYRAPPVAPTRAATLNVAACQAGRIAQQQIAPRRQHNVPAARSHGHLPAAGENILSRCQENLVRSHTASPLTRIDKLPRRHRNDTTARNSQPG